MMVKNKSRLKQRKAREAELGAKQVAAPDGKFGRRRADIAE
jgi:hypothetical protein